MRGIEEKDIENMPKMLISYASEMRREAFLFLCNMSTNEIPDSELKTLDEVPVDADLISRFLPPL